MNEHSGTAPLMEPHEELGPRPRLEGVGEAHQDEVKAREELDVSFDHHGQAVAAPLARPLTAAAMLPNKAPTARVNQIQIVS